MNKCTVLLLLAMLVSGGNSFAGSSCSSELGKDSSHVLYKVVISKDGNVAYCAYHDGYMGVIYIYDISTPSSPIEKNSFYVQGGVSSLSIYDNRLYLLNYSSFIAYDISDPFNPDLIANAAINGWDCLIRDSVAYIAGNEGMIFIYNIANLSSPVLLSSLNISPVGTAYDVEKIDYQNGYLYATAGDTLAVVEVNDPHHPVVVGTTSQLPDNCSGIVVLGDYAYLSCNTHGLQVLDISDPLHLKIVYFYLSDDVARSLYYNDVWLFMPDSQAGVKAFNISNVHEITLAFSFDTQGYALELNATADLCVVADEEGGIVLEDISGCNPLPGDCDGDGIVSIGEIQKAINAFLGLPQQSCNSDCNHDGITSIGEVQKVINNFLGLHTTC